MTPGCKKLGGHAPPLCRPPTEASRRASRGARPARGWTGFTPIAVLALIVVLAGCQTYRPAPLDPAMEWAALEALEETLSTPPRDDAPDSPGAPQWFPLVSQVDLRDGLGLAEANAIALFHNPDLVAARHAVRVAGAQLLEAGLLENPDLFLGPRFATSGGDVIFPASLSWELPLWGKRRARRDVAGASARIAAFELQARELEVLVQVRETYLDLWRTAREIEMLDKLERTSALVSGWVDQLRAAGELDTTSLWLASWEQDQLRYRRRATHAERRRTIRRLQELLGLLPEPTLEVDVGASTALPELPETTLDSRRRHPRLRAAEEFHQHAESRLRLAVAEQYPSVRLGPEFEDDDGDTSIGFGLGLEIPLFDRSQGAIAAAEAERTAARDRYRAVLLSLAHAEAEARANAGSTAELLELLREGAARRADAALAALEARLELGLSGVLEILATQRALIEARLQQIELETELARARFTASVASGTALREPVADPSREGP